MTLESSPEVPAVASHPPIGLEQRLLAEAVRLYEDNQGAVIDDPHADAAARAAGGDLERRVVARAQALTLTQPLQQALHQLRNVSTLAIVAALILALLAGAATVRTALGPSSAPPINFFWVLGSILGAPTVMLLIWVLLLFIKPGAMTTGSLGGLVLALGRRADRWLHKDSVHAAMAQATSVLLTRTTVGCWALSALSHALWLAFCLGCLLMALLALSAQQYTFGWETTILSERSYVPITRALAFVPDLMGFTTPDAQHISASRLNSAGASPEAAREAWSGLLVGAVLAYGLLPRAVLLVLCGGLARRSAARFQFDMSLTGYMRLQARLQPITAAIGVVDPDSGPSMNRATGRRPEFGDAGASLGSVAIIGLEIEPPRSAWPPPLAGVDWLDLGLVDSRDQRRRALARIRETARPPRLIVVVCSLASTPDRGTRSFLAHLRETIQIDLALLLTEGQRLRARGHSEEMAERVADWYALASAAGIETERTIEVDLDHFTDASRTTLAGILGVDTVAGAARRIESAFDLIVDHVKYWSGVPNANQQAELHRAIARLYSNESGERQSWQNLLRTPVKSGENLGVQMKSGAERMTKLLPLRLRQQPRWLAAGATAGALGCVAAATLVAPAAIAALPMWAGLGAALSLALPASSEVAASPAATATDDFTTAVSSAALFALLLELQGRSETSITRILDRIVGDAEPRIDGAVAARAWLDTLRHRFDLALVGEDSA